MPGGRYRLTPLYDVLTAQPSLDARQINRRQFKLAVAVGTSRHYAISEITARHFIQTAEAAGIGKAAIRSAIEEIAASAETKMAAVAEVLPTGFPEVLVTSVMAGVKQRARTMEV
jgi:serine/threonine-protein kinase HipA